MVPPVVIDGCEYFTFVAHPSQFADLRLTPRERWKMEYREQRMRAKGYSEREIRPLLP